MKKIISPQFLTLTLAINTGLIFTLVFTNAILVSDHQKTILEWILAILYLPQTIFFAVATGLIFGHNHPGQFIILAMAFIFGLPASWLYSHLIFKLKAFCTRQ